MTQSAVISLIITFSYFYPVSAPEALSIAHCESNFGKYIYNFEGSSAKGIFQFTDKTWKYYCKGDVLNPVDNIRCFFEIYPKHKNWWKCQANITK